MEAIQGGLTEGTVALVLDTSAILAYTQGKAGVEEIVATVVAAGATVVAPAVAVAETRGELDYREELARLDALVATTGVRVAPLDGADAVGLGRLASRLNGTVGLAHAVAEAQRHEARLLTAHGAHVRRSLGELDGIVDL